MTLSLSLSLSCYAVLPLNKLTVFGSCATCKRKRYGMVKRFDETGHIRDTRCVYNSFKCFFHLATQNSEHDDQGSVIAVSNPSFPQVSQLHHVGNEESKRYKQFKATCRIIHYFSPIIHFDSKTFHKQVQRSEYDLRCKQ